MSEQWYLLKVQDNEIFGPAQLDQLRVWASGAKISPMDRVSNDDRKTWVRAPMVAGLQMDWLIEMPDNFLYGPTNIGTLQEFLATGEINGNVVVINTTDGSQSRISDLPFFDSSPQKIRGSQEISGLHTEGETITHEVFGAMRHRVVWLEKQVMELQREILLWQDSCSNLRSQFVESTGREPM